VTLALEDWHRWWKDNGSRELRDLLLLWWDPVGAYGVPEARSEYDGYTGGIARLLREGAREDELVAHFAALMPGFGVPVREERDRAAAARIVSWFEQSMKRTGAIERQTIAGADGQETTIVTQPLNPG